MGGGGGGTAGRVSGEAVSAPGTDDGLDDGEPGSVVGLAPSDRVRPENGLSFVSNPLRTRLVTGIISPPLLETGGGVVVAAVLAGDPNSCAGFTTKSPETCVTSI